MIIVKIEKLEYNQYGDVLDLLSKYPYNLINQSYRPNLKTGFFYFQEPQHVPESLKFFIISPSIPTFIEKFKFSESIKKSLIKKSTKKSTKKKEI